MKHLVLTLVFALAACEDQPRGPVPMDDSTETGDEFETGTDDSTETGDEFADDDCGGADECLEGMGWGGGSGGE